MRLISADDRRLVTTNRLTLRRRDGSWLPADYERIGVVHPRNEEETCGLGRILMRLTGESGRFRPVNWKPKE